MQVHGTHDRRNIWKLEVVSEGGCINERVERAGETVKDKGFSI